MIHLLIISENAALPASIQVILSEPARFECRHKTDVESARHLLEMPLFGACLLDAELTSVAAIRQIETIRSANPRLPLIILSGESNREWEEEAALKGADFILAKPVRGPLLNNLFNKLFPLAAEAATNAPSYPLSSMPPARAPHSQTHAPHASLPALEILRDFSRIFSFSLNLKSFAYQFALKLREIAGVSRIAIFLEKSPPPLFGSLPAKRNNRLQCLCSVGIEPELFDYVTLSTRSGIGQAILKSGRILRNDANSGHTLFPPDPEVQREFDLLGGQIAIPILDRERAIGVAVLGERLTGQAFSNEELELLFHLMEELGVAIKGNLLHDHLLAHHKLISSVFAQISSGCLVVDRELNVLHANPASMRFLNLSTPVHLSHLPRRLAGLLYESAQEGKSHQPFLFTDESRPDQTYRVSVSPFQEENGIAGAMMSIEDFTPVEAARKAELKASSFQLIATIAERFAHEIRNALVPIDTCRQLIPENRGNTDFGQTLEATLKQETRRIARLADQLLYLSKQELPLSDTESPVTLLQDAFAQAKPLIPDDAEFAFDEILSSCRIHCNAGSLKHAFFELLLNGFQSSPDKPKVTVSGTIARGTNGTGTNGTGTNGTSTIGTALLTMSFSDRGGGLSPELSATAADPFFTTRNVGVGLGLSVTRKIIEDHHGKLEIKSTGRDGPGGIFVSLPVSIPRK